MRKREFLRELSRRLNNMDRHEANDIIEYYDELIEDTIERTGRREEDVIYDLGSIAEIVKRVNPSKYNINEEKSEKIRYDEFEDEEVKSEKIRKSKTKKEKVIGVVKSNSFLGVVLTIITFPIWFPIMMAIIGVIIGIAVAGIALVIGGIACFIYGIVQAGGSLGFGLFYVGTGVLLIGLSCIFIPLIVKLLTWIINLICKGIKALCVRRRLVYEN